MLVSLQGQRKDQGQLSPCSHSAKASSNPIGHEHPLGPEQLEHKWLARYSPLDFPAFFYS